MTCSTRGFGFPPLLLVVLFLPAAASARNTPGWPPGGRRLTRELAGSVVTRNGQRLRLATELGNVSIRTGGSGKVGYRVRLETPANGPDAERLLKGFTVTSRTTPEGVSLRGEAADGVSTGRLWVSLEVSVPKKYNLAVTTGGGNIECADIGGRVNLFTGGGNISVSNVAGSARLRTAGGHITTRDVAGDLIAETGGGHITAGTIGGDAVLQTGGGHIRVTAVTGEARLETGGGNILLERANTNLLAETAGGQIVIGEADGSIRARTGGGGIRVVRTAGPTVLETGAGSIYLTQVEGAVRATTRAGGITAWFGPDAKLVRSCELESGEGDIVVYLPRQLAITIDALIRLGDEHHVIADPAIPVKVRYGDSLAGARTVRAEAAMNGGGELLRLRTVAGNIRLVLSDTAQQLRLYKQQMELLKRRLQFPMRPLEPPAPPENPH